MVYKHLFQAGAIGMARVRNRIVMPAMGTNFTGTDGMVSDRNLQYYGERARGGVGLIIVEAAYVDQTTHQRPNAIGASADKFIPGLRRLAETIRAEGAVPAVQLIHNGRLAEAKVIGCTPLAPSAIRHRASGELPREMTPKDIRYIADSFAAAAARVAEAGFGAVELHGAHGYLLQQFQSPLSNHRTDGYGGLFEKRVRFPLEVVRAVRKRVGPDFPIIYRLSAMEFEEGGITTAETVEFSHLLKAEGIAALHVSVGTNETAYTMAQVIQPMYFEPGNLAKYARIIKDQVSLPVIAVGRINHPDVAEAILARGDADFVATGRALTADPHWPLKASEGRAEEINYCLACNVGCIGRLVQGRDVKCAQNPWVGTDYEDSIPVATVRKRVLVLGGGPAGLEAARVAASRGHQVTLLEKNHLGGQVQLACVPPCKAVLEEVVRSRVRDLQKLGVEVKCGIEASPIDISPSMTDVVIEATGAVPATLEISTEFPEKVFSAWRVLAGQEVVGRQILIIGAGMVGLETADLLASKGKNVVIIEVLEQVGQTITPTTRAVLMARLETEKVKIITSVSLEHWGRDGAAIRKKDGSTTRLEGIDSAVIAVGSRPNRSSLAPPNNLAIIWKRVGDCEKPRDIFEDIQEAAKVAMEI
jgi:2,4-dienoyl-CoA reductase-like NADH-dependent reductase (Old Yellow Enzyme family)/thioredoxin reductase